MLALERVWVCGHLEYEFLMYIQGVQRRPLLCDTPMYLQVQGI